MSKFQCMAILSLDHLYFQNHRILTFLLFFHLYLHHYHCSTSSSLSFPSTSPPESPQSTSHLFLLGMTWKNLPLDSKWRIFLQKGNNIWLDAQQFGNTKMDTMREKRMKRKSEGQKLIIWFYCQSLKGKSLCFQKTQITKI